VKKVILAVLLVACFVSVAVAADNSVAVGRPDIIASSAPGHGFVNPQAVMAAKELVFATNYGYGYIYVYDTTGKMITEITGLSGPQGLTVDQKGNLYCADTNNSNVLVYKPPYTKSPTTLSDANWYPAGVAVLTIGKNTWVAASNICSAPDCTQGGFTIYKNGKEQTPFQSSSIYRVYFVDFDKKGNLYADGENSSGSVVVGWVPGATKGKTTFDVLTTGNSIEFPGGVQVTSKGDIAIDDQEGYAVYTYKPPVKGSLGSPIATTSLSGASDVVEFALTANNKDLWGGDYGNSAADEWAYTAGGSAVTSFSTEYPIGIAVYPADKP